MTIRIFVGHPPNRESPQAEFHTWREDGVVEVPAYIVREDGELRIELFSQQGGEPEWVYSLDDFVQAIEEAKAALGSN